jgi:predicted RNA binding protein YcfA (HicA-like mRNA interferase family)
MSRLPQVTPRQMLAALARAGFETRRVKGSHHYLVHKDEPNRRTTVAVHPGDLPPRDVHDILRQAKISRDEFLRLL